MCDFLKIANNDAKEFKKMFEHYYEPLVEYACYYVGDQDTAENIAQDVFVNIWKNRQKIKLKKTLKIYLFSAIKKTALRAIRDRNTRNKYFTSLSSEIEMSESPNDNVIIKELESAIENAINQLPEKGRLIFCMNRFDGLTYVEIADILGISVKTVETHMFRALQFLRKNISQI